MTASTIEHPTPGLVRRLSASLYRHPWAKLGLMLAPPLAWLMLIYLVALGLMLVTSFWRLNELSGEVERAWGLQNYETIVGGGAYRTIVLNTLRMAAAVTVTDLLLAFPIAYYAARLATSRVRAALLLAIVMPLWANYLIRVFSWRIITAGDGPLQALLGVFGVEADIAATNWAVWLTFCYLWLPFAILPVYAALERVPASLLEASSDLGARSWMTFRRVVFPIIFPGIVAASIFTFSLTLGDYITPVLVGKSFFIGNAIYNLVGLASNFPLAAALSTIPIVIMAVYLTIARKLGAFEAL